MKLRGACHDYESRHDLGGDRELTRRINDEAQTYVSNLDKSLARLDPYVVSSSKRLVPPHIPTDQNSRDTFVVKAGLILFHGTVHDANVDFDYPTSGSFFATTPAHSLAVLCFEKRGDIVKGMRYITKEERLQEDENYHAKIEAMCGKYPPQDDPNYEDCFKRALKKRSPSVGRLLTYMLKKDVVLSDAPGDSLSLEECQSLGYDGVIAAYRPDQHHETGQDISPNLNEVRLCVDNMEDYLELLDTRIISPEELGHQVFQDLDIHQDYLTQNVMAKEFFMCPSDDDIGQGWTIVKDSGSLMHVYFKLFNEIRIVPDLSLLVLLFHPNSHVYVDTTFENIVILNDTNIKVQTFTPDLEKSFQFVQALVRWFEGLSDGIMIGRLKVKLVESIKITLYDEMVSRFQLEGFDLRA